MRPARILASLRGRLLVLTVLFIMIAEVLVYVPSVAVQRERLLMQHLEMAQLAALAREARPGERMSPALEEELLRNAGVYTISLKRKDQRLLMLSVADPPEVDLLVTLGDDSFFGMIGAVLGTALAPPGRTLNVRGTPVEGGGNVIEFTLPEARIRAALLQYSVNILALSLVISLIAAGLVFFSLDRLFLRPMRRIAASMMAFRANPGDAGGIIVPRDATSEFGEAEAALRDMQREVHAALHQKTRLAALGMAVSKINHDLRNILGASQLLSDRLALSDDPAVKRIGPKLTAAIDRAIGLCANTLRYGRAEEPAPRPRVFALSGLVAEVISNLNVPAAAEIGIENRVAGDLEVFADSEQIFRVLLNLARNAIEAMTAARIAGGRLVIAAEEAPGETRITLADTGPGIPEPVQARLFQPFVGTARQDGTGLGLAIAAELIAMHGGRIRLARSDATGTLFEITLPRRDMAG